MISTHFPVVFPLLIYSFSTYEKPVIIIRIRADVSVKTVEDINL